jgi:hypothetical protein
VALSHKQRLAKSSDLEHLDSQLVQFSKTIPVRQWRSISGKCLSAQLRSCEGDVVVHSVQGALAGERLFRWNLLLFCEEDVQIINELVLEKTSLTPVPPRGAVVVPAPVPRKWETESGDTFDGMLMAVQDVVADGEVTDSMLLLAHDGAPFRTNLSDLAKPHQRYVDNLLQDVLDEPPGMPVTRTAQLKQTKVKERRTIVTGPAAKTARQWVSSKGKKTTGRLVAVEGMYFVLNVKGKMVRLHADNFSFDDRSFVSMVLWEQLRAVELLELYDNV